MSWPQDTSYSLFKIPNDYPFMKCIKRENKVQFEIVCPINFINLYIKHYKYYYYIKHLFLITFYFLLNKLINFNDIKTQYFLYLCMYLSIYIFGILFVAVYNQEIRFTETL